MHGPNPQSLRSLSGLIDFDSAARCHSFRLAALELHKTPAAVSQQIKQLETALGFALFIRHPRRVTLTAQGRELAVTVAQLLRELNAKVASLRAEDDPAVLRVSATHSFAMKWLMPRLHRFAAAWPAIDLRLESEDRLVDLQDGGCDLAIRYVRVEAASTAELLFRERWLMVYSPALFPASAPTLSELARQPLLHEGSPALWRRVLAENRIDYPHFDFSRSYSHGGLLVQAAVAGYGVALAHYSLAEQELRQGRLVAGPCAPLPADYGYRLMPAAGGEMPEKVRRFVEWIKDEVAAMEAGAASGRERGTS